jgi:Na+/H+-dicarboxylate symporter
MRTQNNPVPFLIFVALAGWIVPGGGYFVIKEFTRGIIVFLTICLVFCAGIYIGSIGIVDWVGSFPWFLLQMANSPLVAVIGTFTAGGAYPVFGRPCEIGQIYTGTTGWLNMLCIINAVYLAYYRKTNQEVS